MHSTNYRNTLILVSEDSKAATGLEPAKPGSIAELQLSLVRSRPYQLTSDDLLFQVHLIRNDVPDERREAARAEFFSTPRACLRASPLVKQFGWGIHHDDAERIAVYAIDSEKYRLLSDQVNVRNVAGMRSKRT